MDTDITETVEENAVDMAQGGVIIEAKRLQVIYSKMGLLIIMLTKSVDLNYVQEIVHTCLIKAVHKTINESGKSSTKKGIAKDMNYKIHMDCGYPPLNFIKFEKGSDPTTMRKIDKRPALNTTKNTRNES